MEKKKMIKIVLFTIICVLILAILVVVFGQEIDDIELYMSIHYALINAYGICGIGLLFKIHYYLKNGHFKGEKKDE